LDVAVASLLFVCLRTCFFSAILLAAVEPMLAMTLEPPEEADTRERP
jgi:hypothetical protein